MSKIFYYELKRFVLSRIFLGMFLINGIYAWFVLATDIIIGIAYTAPFSGWSYCTYLGKTMPIAVITVLLMLAGSYSKKQKQVEILTCATPVTASCQMLIRAATIGVCFALICILEMLAALLFFVCFFQFDGFEVYLVPSLLIILPCFVFFIGLGLLLGRLHQSLIYVLILATFVVGFFNIGIKNAFDLFGAGYFSSYPLTLPVGNSGEPDFVVRFAFIAARIVYLGIGTICIYISILLSKRKSRQA